MKKTFTHLLIMVVLLLSKFGVEAQNNFFTDVKESSIKIAGLQRVIIPQKYRTTSLDILALKNFLKNIPGEKKIADHAATPVIAIPQPNGTVSHFHIWESSIMEPALAAKFPDIKTYSGQGIDDPAATIKIDVTPLGFHAMILSSSKGSVFIDPYAQGTITNYISYNKSDFKATEKISEPELPVINRISLADRPATPQNVLGGNTVGTQLRTYRIAIACTDQYAAAATGIASPSVAQTLSAITTSLNRVDGIYETELAIHLVLVANEDAIIFNNPGTDPIGQYNNQIANLIPAGQNIIDANIGDANYDIGETFSTGAGGASYVGIVCQSGLKSYSAVGVQNPVGDPFNVDYVSHEIGHEFGAHHPFNSNTSFCGASGQDYGGTNVEPGSGSTVVSYASSNLLNGLLCGSDNLQSHSDPYFNTVNFDEIVNYISSTGTCAAITPTINHSSTNHPPNVNAGLNYTIPLNTPFVLTGSATDPDGDSLTYCWEEYDIGGNSAFGPWNMPTGNAPIFRSFLPVTVPYRYFPQLSDVIDSTTTIGEIMPSYARTLHFRLTARDNRAGGGGVSYSANSVIVDGSSGPFVVTNPDATNITWYAGNYQTVTWNPANTQNAPVNCSMVTIQLSLDGGLTYPITLVDSAANTGTAQVLVPHYVTTTARIRVMAVGNVFYNISKNNFTIKDTTVSIGWISFTGTAQANNTALLNWVVDEQNVDHYIVERTSDAVNYDTIAIVNSTTGTGTNVSYSYVDNSPLQGGNYYRVIEVNKNGSYQYSKIVKVSFTDIPSNWTVYPNPSANGNINITSNSNGSNVQIGLFDAEGKLVYKNALSQTTTGQVINISSARFARGIYALKISSSLGVSVHRVLIE